MVNHQFYQKLQENSILLNVEKETVSRFINHLSCGSCVSDTFSIHGKDIRSSTIFSARTNTGAFEKFKIESRA